MAKPGLLTREETVDLVRKAQAGDLGARNTLIERNLGLVHRIARRYRTRCMQLDELVHEGVVGFITAIERFDVDAGVKLTTYAGWWIYQAIGTAIMNTGRTVRLPKHMVNQLHKWHQMRQEMTPKGGSPPTFDAVCDAMGMSEEQRIAIRMAMHFRFSQLESLDVDFPVLDDEGLADKRTTPEEDREDLLDLDFVLGKLRERDQTVIRRRYGLGGADVAIYKEIAPEIGCTREWVRRIEGDALARMRAIYEGRAAV